MKHSVLLVEDDLDLAATVIDYLELEEISCDYAANGIAGLALINDTQKEYYDVIILDLNMPKMDGLTLCKTMRDQGINTSVIMLTACDTLNDKLAGFDSGSDDYMTKPFDIQELVARIKVLAKRSSGQSNKITVHDLVVDFDLKTAVRDTRELQLSPTCWILLELLIRKSPQVVSRKQLSQAVWGDNIPNSNSLKVHLFKLRQQVDGNNKIKLLHTIAGQGVAFRFDPITVANHD